MRQEMNGGKMMSVRAGVATGDAFGTTTGKKIVSVKLIAQELCQHIETSQLYSLVWSLDVIAKAVLGHS
jgi:hypothetical protein